MRVFRYQHVGIGYAKSSRWGCYLFPKLPLQNIMTSIHDLSYIKVLNAMKYKVFYKRSQIDFKIE